jgi:cation diffusion facilitator CzcD-associated flavoprotein CzcO
MTGIPAVDDIFAKIPSSQILHRDVCVIGGGCTGVYSAIQLRDKGQRIVVVESKGRLGEY